jgi:hypothetical protein
MSRAISVAAKAALYAPHTSVVFLTLLTIDHEEMDAPVRFVDNLTDVTSRGDVYTAFPFSTSLPPDAEGELPQIDLICDNVTRDLITTVRNIATPASVTMEVVIADTPDTVEVGPYIFDIIGATYDVKEIRFTLMYEPLMQEPFPADIFSPTNFPSLFNAVET